MNVAIVGYGKMGKEIEQILLSRGHHIVAKITSDNPLTGELLEKADVAIEFSTPSAVLSNLQFLLKHNIPTVVGTTGWNKHLPVIEAEVERKKGALVHASNFSIGVNLFFQLNEYLAQLMAPYSSYTPQITETHHTEKLDAPSGTAITLGEGMLKHLDNIKNWYCPQNDNPASIAENDLKIEAIREKGVKGTHLIEYLSEIDTISIEHKAHSRKGFALGAVIAAEWIQHKQGTFTMKDVLQLS